jgi:hypothetical protein
MKILNYLKYSSISVTFLLNPFQWYFVPTFFKTEDVWDGNSFNFRFIFLALCLSIDDGSW